MYCELHLVFASPVELQQQTKTAFLDALVITQLAQTHLVRS